MQTTTIRTRPDGSIDTDYYIRLGRRARSEQAHALMGINRSSRRPR